MIRFLLISASLVALASCGERDQSMTTSAARSGQNDTPPWQGAKNPYMAKGWTAGDKTSWETQLRTRSQAQNEYVKVD